jgi:Putative beta barrel porin-7 (BBP7)
MTQVRIKLLLVAMTLFATTLFNTAFAGGEGLFAGLGGIGGSGGNRPSAGPGRVWFGSEYLLWQTSGMYLPPLVTSNPLNTSAQTAGVIGVPSTQVLLGNQYILDGANSGIRFGGGFRLCEWAALEGDYFQLFGQEASFNYDASLGVILGRPFINLAPLQDPVRYDTQLIHFPPTVTGNLRISAASDFFGAGGRLRLSLLRNCCLPCNPCNSCDSGCKSSCDTFTACCPPCVGLQAFNLTLGYRHLNLKDHLRIDETVIAAGDRFEIYDEFRAQSAFHGFEFGLDTAYCCHLVNFGGFGRIAAGMTTNDIHIGGQTIDVINNVTTTRVGGILAQSSNSGDYQRNVASFVAETGLNLNARITSRISARAGYSVLYWGNVARAGDQIDLHVNPDLFPPATAVPGTIGAQPTFKLNDYFAHGLNTGITVSF